MADRNPAAELGLNEALRTRVSGIGSLSMVLRIAVATTVSFLLAARVSHSTVPVFAPITTLLVIQASPFSTLGLTAQRVLGTGLGVAVATVYVNLVPITWWSVLLALVVSLLVARLLPVGLVGQLQLPIATVFVLALGPTNLATDMWRVLDVALGGAVGVAAVFLLPPRPQLAPAVAAYERFVSAIAGVLLAMADEIGSYEAPVPAGTRHLFAPMSRALRDHGQATRDALVTAVESTRFNVRARGLTEDLTDLELRVLWAHRVTLHVRSLAGAVDRLYDRAEYTPVLPATSLAPLLRRTADLVLARSAAGDEVVAATADALATDVRSGIQQVSAQTGEVTEWLQSLTILGRLEQLREVAVVGPTAEVEMEEAGAQAVDASSSRPLLDRLRELGR